MFKSKKNFSNWAPVIKTAKPSKRLPVGYLPRINSCFLNLKLFLGDCQCWLAVIMVLQLSINTDGLLALQFKQKGEKTQHSAKVWLLSQVTVNTSISEGVETESIPTGSGSGEKIGRWT